MAETWKRLFGPATLTNSAATKYTVPASTKTVVRKMRVTNTDTSARAVTISIGSDATGTRIMSAQSVPAKSSVDVWGPFVLTAAEVIQAFDDAGSVVNLTIDGVEYTL